MDYTMYDHSSYQIFQAESRHWQPSPALEQDERAYMDACKAVLRAERVTEECDESRLAAACKLLEKAQELVEDAAQELRSYGATTADIQALADQARDEWRAECVRGAK